MKLFSFKAVMIEKKFNVLINFQYNLVISHKLELLCKIGSNVPKAGC